MISKEINGGTLEYFEDGHIYLYNGIMLPSVSRILGYKYPDEFANVPKSVLEKAAQRGTDVHENIENFCKFEVNRDKQEVKDFMFLQKQYKFEVLDNEVPLIIFDEKGTAVACGRLDLTIEADGKIGIADIKTNSVLNKEKIAYQLNLYRIGFQQCYNVKIDFLKIIHIRKGTRKYIDVPIIEEMTYQLLKEYVERTENE